MIKSTYTVDAHSSDPGLVVQTDDHAANPFNYDLSVGESVTFALFDIWTDENSLDTRFFSCGDDCDHMPITVDFGFQAPGMGQGSIDGHTYGAFTGFLDLSQEGKVRWNDPLDFGFGPNGDGRLSVSLSDENFNKGLFGLDEGQGDGATVDATLTLVSDASSADVPEPGTFGLFGLAMVLIGFATYRRRSSMDRF